MQRRCIVLDTNVLISAIIFGRAPRTILEMVIAGKVRCALSFAILDELRDVLQRPKFGFTPEQAVTVVEELRGVCEILNPARRLRTIKADPDDNRILECAPSNGIVFRTMRNLDTTAIIDKFVPTDKITSYCIMVCSDALNTYTICRI